MARPANFPVWATGANFTVGPQVGSPTKVAPSGTRLANGWVNTDVPPAQEQNYWQNLADAWIEYLDDRVATEETTRAAGDATLAAADTAIYAAISTASATSFALTVARTQMYSYSGAGYSFSTTSTTPVAATGYSVTVPSCSVGDKLQITWSALIYTGGAGVATFTPTVTDGVTDYGFSVSTAATSATDGRLATLTYTHTVLTAGTVTVWGKLFTSGGTATMIAPANISILRLH